MRTHHLLAATTAFLCAATPLAAHETSPEQSQIENRIASPVVFKGEEDTLPSLEERMAQLGVPSASIAVYRNGRLSWARAYGEGMDTDTLFQAASLSKAVAAAGLATLAHQRGVSLDTDISKYLIGLDLTRINPHGLPITLRGLLSHTSGARVSGFPGYPAGAKIPTTAQVVMGDGPTNTDMVVFEPDWQGEFHYSGGGYTVAQHWAERITGEDFAAIMHRLVLEPLEMRRSLFAASPRADFPRKNVASAVFPTGDPIEGGWHVYPEHAAASLWTTPSEYGLFVAGLIEASRGNGDAALPRSVAREMLAPVSENYGLGIAIETKGGKMQIGHSGSNVGYKTNFVAFPDSGDVLIVMAASESSSRLVTDVTLTAMQAYGWPGDGPIERFRMSTDPLQMATYAGLYRRDDGKGPTITIRPIGSELVVSLPNGITFPLVRVGEEVFINPEDGQEATFVVEESGRTSIKVGSNTYLKE